MYANPITPNWFRDGPMAGQTNEIQFQEYKYTAVFSIEITERIQFKSNGVRAAMWEKLPCM